MKENNTFNEQQNPSGLPESLRVNPFDVPENYFDDLSTQVLAQVEIDHFHVDASAGFTVPQGYFEILEEQLMGQVALPEVDASENGFAPLPTGYFDQMQAGIFAKIAEEKLHEQVPTSGQQETPVRTLKRPQWIRYAAAACITAVLGVGAYTGLNTPTSDSNNMDLASVSDQEIINYLAEAPVSEDIIYMAKYADELQTSEYGLGSQVQNDEIEEYLNYML